MVPVLMRQGISYAEGVQLSMVGEWGLSKSLWKRRYVCVLEGLLKNKLCL